MSDLDRILKLSGLVQGNGFEAPVQEGKMSDLDIDAQDNSREAFIEMHSSTLGGAEAAGKFWDDSKESREVNEGPSVPLKKYSNSGDSQGKHDMKKPKHDGSPDDTYSSAPIQDRRRDASKDRPGPKSTPTYPNSGDSQGKHDMKVPTDYGSDTYSSAPIQKRRRDKSKDRTTEAVGSFAEPMYDLCDEVGCDPDHPIFAELIRYLDGDTIKDFVDEYRRVNDYGNGLEPDNINAGAYESEVTEEPVQEAEGNRTIEVNKDIQLAGDSIWDKRNENMTQMVHVKEIEIYEDEDGYLSVTVEHDGPWEIYTDTAFPEAISELCDCDLDWSEQGMQDEGMAHLEGELMEAYESKGSISETFHTELMRELKD